MQLGDRRRHVRGFAQAVRDGHAPAGRRFPRRLAAPGPGTARAGGRRSFAAYSGGGRPTTCRDGIRRRPHTSAVRTLEITPPGDAEQRILEMGAYLQITPALKMKLGYGEVRGCYYGPTGRIDTARCDRRKPARNSACEIDHFDAEIDVFPIRTRILTRFCAAN